MLRRRMAGARNRSMIGYTTSPTATVRSKRPLSRRLLLRPQRGQRRKERPSAALPPPGAEPASRRATTRRPRRSSGRPCRRTSAHAPSLTLATSIDTMLATTSDVDLTCPLPGPLHRPEPAVHVAQGRCKRGERCGDGRFAVVGYVREARRAR